ncbi:hypothetical protein [Comamonas kerstersii]|uniref:hypothetical protein n=1 Tax=Comamonas kerstersii TaxID=225992 RepID=UPI001248EB1D|nr:hypothetical protein [Comamonas kerstersii]
METIFSLLWSLVVVTFKFGVNAFFFFIRLASDASEEVQNANDDSYMDPWNAYSNGHISYAEYVEKTRINK